MTPNSTRAITELNIDAHLGEGPIWDETLEKLWWVDILSGTLNVYDPRKRENTAYQVGEHLGAVALREKGGMVMALQSGFAFFDPETGDLTKIHNPESHLVGNRFNDGKCDPAGRFWAGTMSYELEKGKGSLYCLTPDLKVDVKLTNITISNGLAWNRERTRFFYIDTPTSKIDSFDFDEGTGEIANRKALREMEASEGYPDGMTVDEENFLWVALYGGGKVIRIDPSSGKTVYEVYLPVPKVTSCTFGGRYLDQLYITTCREHMSRKDLEEAPLSGSLFKAFVPFKGVPAIRFAG